MRERLLLTLMLAAFAHFTVTAAVVYVSPFGDDSNDGSRTLPVRTLERALAITRADQGASSTILLEDGVYYLESTIVLNHLDNGLTIKAVHPGGAVVSGGKEESLSWKKAGNGIFCARMRGGEIDQLYIDGIRQPMARYPDASSIPGCNVYDVWNLGNLGADMESAVPEKDALSPSRVARWKSPEGGYVHAMHAYLWGDMHWLVEGKERPDSLRRTGGWQNNRPSPMHPLYRFVENIREELDSPGEWYFDRKKGLLYCMPPQGIDISSAKVETVRLKHLLEVRGSRALPACGISISGLVFRHASRTFMDNKEPLLRSDWTIYRGGAVVFECAEDCGLTLCEFDQVGGNTVFVNKYNRRISISGCYIHDSGANGIAFVGDTSAVRSPVFGYGNNPQWDTVPGPRGDDYPAQCTVHDCLIVRTGRFEKQTAPIQISMSYGIHVDHCSIYDVPRAGINISEGTFGGHVIENCDIFDTVLETGDHGSFNSWGRDRYWKGDVKETSDFLLAHPGAERWDMMGENVLRHNRVRCDHGWDIDLDDGSSNFTITENLLLRGGLKLREGKNRNVTNNIIVGNSLHPHVWYEDSGDIFAHNIVCSSYRPAIMGTAIGEDGKWGWQVDFNFFACGEEEMKEYSVNGCDANSMWGNPMFVDPAHGNYQVAPASGAIKVGFHNFRMDDFGVVSERLKAIARTPEMPVFIYSGAAGPKGETASFSWGGAVLVPVSGEALSAWGMDLGAFGLCVSALEDGSPASLAGLRKGDLVIELNKVPLSERDDLAALLSSEPVSSFSVIRNQERLVIDNGR